MARGIVQWGMQEHSIGTKMVSFVCLTGLEQGAKIMLEGYDRCDSYGGMN